MRNTDQQSKTRVTVDRRSTETNLNLMSGHSNAGSIVVVLMFAFGMIAVGCQSTEAADPNLTSPTSRPTTTTEPAATTSTTRPNTTPTTLSELEQAEADIALVVEAWWTYDRDTSLGEEGLPLQHTTGLLYDRLVALVSTLEQEGQIYRSRGPGQIQIVESQIDLAAGIATVDVCALANAEIIDAATENLIGEDSDDATLGSVSVAIDDTGQWKVGDYFDSERVGNPQICTIDTGSP